jgi:hypothetical protein
MSKFEILRRKHVSSHKFLYRGRKGEGNTIGVEAHLTVGYNGGTIKDYQEMAAEMRKTFPGATDDKVKCGTVTRSTCCEGHSIIVWSGAVEDKEYPGWHELRLEDDPEYRHSAH